MQRHITDHPKSRSDAPRVRAYLDIERGSHRHQAYDVLHRQHRASGSDTAVVKFCEIDRGYDV